ncbi:MAG: glycosyltransferase, partial [Acidobacteria bacterium]|nr:glycosyltransferase [Acidobacteriota bacterium]
ASEHCDESLSRRVVGWLLEAIQLADHLLVISRATAADVAAVAKRLGRTIPSPVVVTLDARFGKAVTDRELQNSQVLVRYGIEPGGYVLFVGTVESRKNHLLALSGWLTLLKRFGARRVPKLVCVGKRGWLSEPVYAKLQASSALRQHVLMLSGISDADLQRLYRGCLFTLYPSAYEGWGLPITESLCFGKVSLLSRCSSLPEAGGEFGEYFELDSEGEFVRKLERLIFDAEYRAAKERKIAAEFHPRTWLEIAGQLLDLVRGWAAVPPGAPASRRWTERELWPVEAVLGRYYPLRENRETQIWPGITMGEIFRQGDGWWWPESWGCWTKYKPARLALVARLRRGSGAVLFLGIRGLPKFDCTASVSVEGVGRREVQLRPLEDKWLIFRADKQALDRLRDGEHVGFEILLSSDRGVDLRELTQGADTRKSSIGVLGFMLCEDGDVAAQLHFIGSAALGDMESLIASPEPVDLPPISAAPPQSGNRPRNRARPVPSPDECQLLPSPMLSA